LRDGLHPSDLGYNKMGDAIGVERRMMDFG
jgi:hypothetical protein